MDRPTHALNWYWYMLESSESRHLQWKNACHTNDYATQAYTYDRLHTKSADIFRVVLIYTNGVNEGK